MKIRFLLTAFAVLAMGTAAQAALVTSFEGGVDGWGLLAPGTIGTSTTPAAAVTDGSSALHVNDTYSAGGTFHEVVRTFLTTSEYTDTGAGVYDALEFDLYIPAAGGAVLRPLLSWSGGNKTFANETLVDGLTHFSLDITDVSHASAWSIFTLRANGTGLGDFYIDNVQLTTSAVPEAATFSLFGLGAVMAWSRRRRR